MKRVLILVLSTDKPPYDKLYEASRQTWDSHEVDGVKTIFYFARSSRSGLRKEGKCLYTDSDDDFFSMGKKTLFAFEWALANREFDYIFRANASLYIDKAGLAKYCLDKPEHNLALGVIAPGPFLWGPSYMLSRDVVQKVVENKDQWDHTKMDDVAISRLLQDVGIPLDNRGSMASVALKNGGYEFTYYENGSGGGAFMADLADLPRRLPDQFAFRVKDDANRENDVRLMKELHEVFK